MLDTHRSVRAIPLPVLAELLAIVFATEVGVMFLLPAISTKRLSGWTEASIDAFLLVLILAPALWGLLVRPLQREHEESESRLSDLVGEQSRILESFFKHTQTCLVFLDRRFNFIRVNDAYAKACRRDVSEFAGRNHFELYPSDAKADFERVVQTREPFQAIGRTFMFPDHPEWGVTYWDWTLVPIQDDRGEVEFLVFSLNDVTERTRSEEALRCSENRYRTLVDNLPQRVFVKDKNFAYVSMNELYARDLNVKAMEAAGKTDYDFFPKELAEKYRADDARIMASGRMEEIDEEYTKEGQRLTVHTVKTPVRDQQGGATGVLGIFWDVTEQKRVDHALTLETAALRESNARVRELSEHIQEVFWSTNAGMDEVLYISPAYEQVWGRTCQSLYDSPRQWIEAIHPEDRGRVLQVMETTIETGDTYDQEYRILQPNGTARWIRDRAFSVRDDAGAIKRFVGIAADLTERKLIEDALRESEERLRISQEAAHWGVFDYKYQSGENYWSPELEALWGFSKGEFGRTADAWRQRIHPEDRAEVKRQEERALETGQYLGEYRIVWPDGSLRWMYSRGRVSYDERGQPSRLLGINLDITDRKQLEMQFRQAQKMESVGQLASGIAHDFNNLLTVINGTAEFLLKQVSEDGQVRADVEEILRAGERAVTLTRQLLAFSRQQILEPRVLNLNTVVAGTESLLRRLLSEDVSLVVVPTPDPGHVMADPGQIEQVIINLAVNARDAMPQGGQLTIETWCVTIDKDYARQLGITMPAGSYVLLTVSDSGVGMDEATRARIFEPFFTTKGPGQGTGLGLSTVYGIVKQSRGFIWVDSEVGKGTSFKIYLPQVVTEAAATDRPEPTVVSTSGTETILLVEDNAGLRKLATRLLKPAGYTVLDAATGEEALRVLERHEAPVHLLLTDVVMPGMGGRELVERLAQTHPEMKVIYMSGYTSDAIVRHGVLEAKVSFLNKPFTEAALLRKVREVLDA